MRETSVAAYNQIKAEGLLSSARFLVYECLVKHGPLTSYEICERISIARVTVSPRLVELKRLGVVKEACTRACLITGRQAIAWEATDDLPSGSARAVLRRFWVVGGQAFPDPLTASQNSGGNEIIAVVEERS